MGDYMNRYTDVMENAEYDIYPEDDNYIERLIDIAQQFRTFDEALDSFMIERSMIKENASTEDKIECIKDLFKKAGIDVPRKINEWYKKHIRIEKKTAIQFCFAFDLDIQESEDFFRRICLMRSFDCHNIEEVVYYYAICNNLTYMHAQEIITQIQLPDNARMNYEEDIVYTESIRKEVNSFATSQDLICYINDNISYFTYSNATAYSLIKKLWNEIACEGGIAKKERAKYDIVFKDDYIQNEYETEDFDVKRNSGKENKKREESLWNIYLQILGFYGMDNSVTGADRSIKPLLKNNVLIHTFAQESFPDRDGLNKILLGVRVSEEKTRKTLILLAFYWHFAKIAIQGSRTYEVKNMEIERGLQTINGILTDAGYPELYHGNPYDWIFLFVLNSQTPLVTFRIDIMREIYNIWREQE